MMACWIETIKPQALTRSREVVERTWEWHFNAPPEALWPLFADTARFNEAAGLWRYDVTDTPLPDGTVKRTGRVHLFGMTLTWEEGVPQWIAGRCFSHQRIFSSGPLRRLVTYIDIDPEAGADGRPASRARYRLKIEARSILVALLFRLGALNRFGATLDRLFRDAAGFAEGQRDHAYEVPPPTISDSVRDRVAERVRGLAERGYGSVERLASFVLEAAETDLERMRPRAFARRWRMEARGIIETFLAAARDGLLTLHWDLVCPRCRGAKVVVTSLDRLPHGAHCPSCDVDYDRDFSQNVEVTFEPGADIRRLGSGTYCLASPLAAEHIKVQQWLAPGRVETMEAELPDGDYRVRTVEPGGTADFQIQSGIIPEIILDPSGPSLGPRGSRGIIRACNAGVVGRTLVIEDRRWTAEALTAHEVTTLQAFRDLFAETVLRPGDQVEIRRGTFLFTDIKGSSDLYNRVGDAHAYGLVREHYAVLTSAIRQHDGAVVKTIGDAVMAAFYEPVDAFRASLRIRDAIEAFNSDLAAKLESDGVGIIVRVGLHAGPCIAVTLNDRLDYFGRTVNLAARLVSQSQGGDIVLSDSLAAENGVAELIDGLNASEESVMVKGFTEPVRIRRIPVHAADGCRPAAGSGRLSRTPTPIRPDRMRVRFSRSRLVQERRTGRRTARWRA